MRISLEKSCSHLLLLDTSDKSFSGTLSETDRCLGCEAGLVHWCLIPARPPAAELPSLWGIQAMNVIASCGPQVGCEGERPAWSHLKSYVEGAAAKERGCHLHCHHFGPSHDHSSLGHCNNLLLKFLLLKPSLRLISSQSLGVGQGSSNFGSSPGSCVQPKLKSTTL